MDELFNFALSQEELLALLLIADLPAPAGFETLPEQVFGDWPEDVRTLIMSMAERSLVAKGMLAIVDEPELGLQTRIQPGVRTALETVTQPEATWVMLHQPVNGADQASYFHRRGDVQFGHVVRLGVHQFLLALEDAVAQTVLELVQPIVVGDSAENPPPPITPYELQLSEATLQAMLAQPENSAEILADAGDSSESAAAFATTIQQALAITGFAFTSQADETDRRLFTTVRTADTHWILGTNGADTLTARNIAGPALLQLLRDFATP